MNPSEFGVAHVVTNGKFKLYTGKRPHMEKQGLYSPIILENALGPFLLIVLYFESFKCNTTSDWLNRKV